jgi:Neurochondrin
MPDTLDTLQSLSTGQQGADLILSARSASALLKLVESSPQNTHQILNLLHLALEQCSSSTDPLRILDPLAQIFSTTKNPTLMNNLSTFFSTQFQSIPPPVSLQLPLYRGLKSLTLSKLDDSTRTNTLLLKSVLLSHIGPNFLFNPPQPEQNAKQMALLTIRLASIGIQTGFSTLERDSSIQPRLIAEMEILHAATIWLLNSFEGDEPIYATFQIGNESLNPNEILKIQENISAAIQEVSVYLRGKYDEFASEGTMYPREIDGFVKTTIKFVGGWLSEGGGGEDDQSLGLLDVFLSYSLVKDVELTTWSMRGIKGIILYTEDGATELLTSKDRLLKSLEEVITPLSSHDISTETTLMIREICSIFRILLESQPILLTYRPIRSFPTTIYPYFTFNRVDTSTWDARTEAAMLVLDILLKLATNEEIESSLTDIMRKWLSTIKRLIDVQRSDEMRGELEYLASALENLNI